MATMLGQRLGPYEILSAIGAGGMGEVYRARDTRLDRIGAIKVLPVQAADCDGPRERFEPAIGLPIGLQIAGPHGGEAVCLATCLCV